MRYWVSIAERVHEVQLHFEGDRPRVEVDGEALNVTVRLEGNQIVARVEDHSFALPFSQKDGTYAVVDHGRAHQVLVRTELERLQARAQSKRSRHSAELRSPIPGRVVKVCVEAGQEVLEGASLVVLEAMKMQNELQAGAPCTIQSVEVQEGQSVEAGLVLVRFKPSAAYSE